MPDPCPHCGHETEAEACPLCGSPVDGPSGGGASAPGEGAPGGEGGAGTVPWEDPSVPFPDDLVRSWTESLFSPVSFFRRITDRGGFARPLLYFLLATVAGAVFTLVWEYAPLFSASGWDADGPLSPAVFFFLTPFVALVSLALSTLAYHLGAVVLSPEHRGIGATARVVCYAAGPSVLAAVPILGGLVGLVWTWVLQVVGLREAHRTSTVRAVLMVFWLWIVLFLLTAGLIVMAVVSGVGVEEGLRVPFSAATPAPPGS